LLDLEMAVCSYIALRFLKDPKALALGSFSRPMMARYEIAHSAKGAAEAIGKAARF